MNADRAAERRARMGICALKAWSTPAVTRALLEFGADELWRGFLEQGESTTFGRRAAAVDVEAIERGTDACGARFVVPGDEEWPTSLQDLATAEVSGMGGVPAGLWVRGQELWPGAPGVALVGARACTGYGEQVSITLAADLVTEGCVVVSGLAFGIDAAAHRGAIGANGRTWAVLAGGVDSPYPAAHARLAAEVMRSGALISELPPGERPSRHAFLARNRLIAALSQVVVVVEAALRSGAKNTATWAAVLGRQVAAVPGPITSSLSGTPNRLIRDAEASLVGSAAEVLALMAPLGTVADPPQRGEPVPFDSLPPELAELREAVGVRESLTAAQLAGRTGQRIIDVLDRAQQLVERGWLDCSEGGEFSLKSRPLG